MCYGQGMRRWVVLGLWISLLLGVVWGPPPREDLWPWIGRLMTGQWEGENLLVVAEFHLMGVWPVVFAALLRDRWFTGRLPAFPFLVCSFFVGAYVLAPYFFWVDDVSDQEVVRPALSQGFQRVIALLGCVATVLWSIGLIYGDVAGWWVDVQTRQFICLMSCDFLTLWVLFLFEARRRGGPWRWCLVPVVGAVLWLRACPSD